MKKTILVLYFFYLVSSANAQVPWSDSIKNLLAFAKDDTTKFYLLSPVISYYTFSKPDSATIFVQEEISLAKKNKSDFLLSMALPSYGVVFLVTGNYPQAIYFLLEGLKAAERSKNFLQIGWCYNSLADTYSSAADFHQALFYIKKQKSLAESRFKLSKDSGEKSAFKYLNDYAIIGFAQLYNELNQPDSALAYLQILNESVFRYVVLYEIFGNTYFKKGDYFNALKYYKRGYEIGLNSTVTTVIISNCNGLAKSFWKVNQPDSAIFYADKVLEASKYAQFPLPKLEAFGLLAEIYKSKKERDSTVKYLELILATKDSLFNKQKVMQMQTMTFNEQLRQQEILEAQKAYQNRIKTYIFIGGVITLLLIAFLLWRNNRHKQKAYAILQKQKAETDYQRTKAEKTLEELKSTQSQLIQSEKMASLGELTAGIAHEIQNPLNFVNNFSEVNTELIDELEAEIDKGNIDDAKIITRDLKDNEQKILQHGKRADAIVKGMLQHSKTSTGVKEPTDINKLADEYLRLSYHGMRAKDKSFEVKIITDFDESISKINIVPQDIGRVLLNLFNNAFYAVNEKKKTSDENYKPLVTVRTLKNPPPGARWAEIKVEDNGNGIPQNIVDKIFQPFFTTKPTGQGTGLGLSLAYDIIKVHGGEIKAESQDGEGSEFIIQLPTMSS